MIKMIYYESLRNYGYDGNDARIRDMFTPEELERLENKLEKKYPHGMWEGDVENLFADDGEYACKLLGIDFNEFLNRGE